MSEIRTLEIFKTNDLQYREVKQTLLSQDEILRILKHKAISLYIVSEEIEAKKDTYLLDKLVEHVLNCNYNYIFYNIAERNQEEMDKFYLPTFDEMKLIVKWYMED